MSNTTDYHQTAKELPTNILLEKWIDAGFSWVGEIFIHEFERLSKQVYFSENANPKLSVNVQLAKKDGVLWLTYDVQGDILLSCQRCLEPIAFDVTGEYRLAILANEHETSRIGGAEFVLLDEVCPSESRKMLPIKALLEDELLLALPLSPRHDDCTTPIDASDHDENQEQDNPFAVLSALKGKLN
ncbi:YceD family protein [Moraxella nasovis]|uniref:YceD family protein n=1 Tax=Moraxella nasovis TaxID=2904121 RepID=UPI001F602624|nr:YceD family protein [Moraxella nasovis]UNU72714.1 YceD family protein [Moraxella nasovis]